MGNATATGTGTNPSPPPRPRSGLAHLLLHLHPRTVPAGALALPHTFGLGGAAAVLLLLLAVTGALLLAVYEPSPERAHGAVSRIVDDVPFGAFVRNAHHWAANAVVIVSALHLLRVVYRGGHLPPRRGNWLIGVALLLLVVGSAFTGYLLPWDQLAYWAVTIATGMLAWVPAAGTALLRAARGGADVGAPTLARFFVLHVAVLPAALLVLLALHFWRVRKAGGVVLPADGGAARGPPVPTSPHLTVREGAAARVAVAAILLLAAVLDAPLSAPANPGLSPDPARAPWYFQGLQELLVHLHPSFGAVALPLAGLAGLAALPYLAGAEPSTGRWFASPRGALHAAVAAAAALLCTVVSVLASERLRRGPASGPGLQTVLGTGLLPASCTVAAVLLVGLVSRRRGATRAEAVQSAFTFGIVAFAVLTVVGNLFRGPGMVLAWP